MLGNIFGRRTNDVGEKFPRIYSTADWFTADKVCQPDQWNKVGEVTVPAQQRITFGANDPIGGSSIAGRTTYLRFDNSSATQLHGKIRFAITNANETKTVVVLEENTRKLSADENDRTKAVVLPEYPTKAKEDSKLQILFYPEDSSAVTVDQDGTNTSLLIPVTVYQ